MFEAILIGALALVGYVLISKSTAEAGKGGASSATRGWVPFKAFYAIDTTTLNAHAAAALAAPGKVPSLIFEIQNVLVKPEGPTPVMAPVRGLIEDVKGAGDARVWTIRITDNTMPQFTYNAEGGHAKVMLPAHVMQMPDVGAVFYVKDDSFGTGD